MRFEEQVRTALRLTQDEVDVQVTADRVNIHIRGDQRGDSPE